MDIMFSEIIYLYLIVVVVVVVVVVVLVLPARMSHFFFNSLLLPLARVHRRLFQRVRLFPTHLYTQIYIYMYTHTHTHTHICIYIYV